MTPNEIQNKRFDKAVSGYRPEDVNAFLVQVADYVEDVLAEKNELEQKIMVLADKLEEYREDEDSLRAALIGAQKLGDSVVRESKKKAEMILQEASQKADLMATQIRHNIERETDALNKMQAEVARFKSQILSMYRQHIEMVNTIPYDEKDFAPAKPQIAAAEAATNAPAVTAEPSTNARSAGTPEPAMRPAPAKEKEFMLEYEEEAQYAGAVPDDMPLKRERDRESRHPDLGMFFGENSTLTRKE